MSLNTKIPPSSKFIPISVRFTATYNAVTPWRYDWGNEGGPGNLVNRNVFVQHLRKNSVYLLERQNLSFTIPSEEYSAAIGTNEAPYFLPQMKSNSSQAIYTKPWRANDFIRNSETVLYFDTNQKDQLLASFIGMINQTGNMIQYPSVDAIFTANLYEINNVQWIEEYNKRTTRSQGKSLNE